MSYPTAEDLAAEATNWSLVYQDELYAELEAYYEKLGCKLYYIDNPHPSWFGARSLHDTATRLSERSDMSPYTSCESRQMASLYFYNFKLEDNEHMYRGRGQELHILQTFCERHGFMLLQVALIIYPYDVRIGATPDGLALIMAREKTSGKIVFILFDLEAKCPIKETVQPPLMYLAQMAAQLEVTELKDAYLVTHCTTGQGRCWREAKTPNYFRWLRECSHRGMQYDACAISHMGQEWSSRGLRGFLGGPAGNSKTLRRPANFMDPGLIGRTEQLLEQRLADPYQTRVEQHFEPAEERVLGKRKRGREEDEDSVYQPERKRRALGEGEAAPQIMRTAPLPAVFPADQYESPLLQMQDFYEFKARQSSQPSQ